MKIKDLRKIYESNLKVLAYCDPEMEVCCSNEGFKVVEIKEKLFKAKPRVMIICGKFLHREESGVVGKRVIVLEEKQ